MSAPMSIAEIVGEVRREQAAKQFQVLAEIKNAGEHGRTLMEVVRSLTGVLSPGSRHVGPVGHALVALAHRQMIEPTGAYRGKTSALIEVGRGQQVMHYGGAVWVATEKGRS